MIKMDAVPVQDAGIIHRSRRDSAGSVPQLSLTATAAAAAAMTACAVSSASISLRISLRRLQAEDSHKSSIG